ncbi:MAG: winged helix-turn-helix transcriptional regulator [Candidatus Micrarchaeota archaeon]|nr:winged helix-turn-helix transcriptional regulator [Candidatus Micrarchaeota archaeon]
MKKLLSLLLLSLLLGLCFADLERPVLIPYSSANWYVYVAPSDYNYLFAATTDATPAALTDSFPDSWASVNKTVIGPVPLPPSLAQNPRYVDTAFSPPQLLISYRPDLETNCTANQSISNRSLLPRPCAYPRAQLYLPPGSLDLNVLTLNGVANRTYRYDGFYYYIRSHAAANGTIGFAQFSDRDLVEFDFANPAAVASDLLWLSQTGLVSNFKPEDALVAGELASSGGTQSIYPNQALPAITEPAVSANDYAWPQAGRIDALSLKRLELPPITRAASAPLPSQALPAAPPAPAPSAPCSGPSCPASGSPIQPAPSAPAPTAQPLVAESVPAPAPSPIVSSAASAGPSSGWPSWFGPVLGLAGIALIAVMAFYFRPQAVMAPPEPAAPIFLSDSRMALLQELREVDRIPTDLSERLGKSKATVVEQLDGLVQSGLVERVETPGRKFVFYRLTRRGKQALLQYENEREDRQAA